MHNAKYNSNMEVGFCEADTANEPMNVKASMGIHHKCIYTSSCKHVLQAEHHKYRVRSTVHNEHTRGTLTADTVRKSSSQFCSLSISRQFIKKLSY